jgi:hypothetical protein
MEVMGILGSAEQGVGILPNLIECLLAHKGLVYLVPDIYVTSIICRILQIPDIHKIWMMIQTELSLSHIAGFSNIFDEAWWEV